MDTASPLRECWLSFWRGATRPALAALLIALVVMITTSAALYTFLTGQLISGPGHRYFMTDELDTLTNVTRKALSFKPSNSPGVAILGSSVIIRCLVDEQQLATLIARHSGKTPAVYDLGTDGQTSWEMTALADRFFPGLKGVFVIALTPGLFQMPAARGLSLIIENPKLGFVSAAVDNEARIAGIKVPRRTGNYSLDNAHFLLARRHYILLNLMQGGKSYGDPLAAPWMNLVNNPAYWQKEINELPKLSRRYEANRASHLAVLSRLITRLTRNGKSRVILLEAPFNPRWHDIPLGAKFHRRFREDLKQFAELHGVSFVPISDKAQLKPTDFVDYEGHIGTASGRQRCSEALAKSIADELKSSGH